jgi:hypothetical protein
MHTHTYHDNTLARRVHVEHIQHVAVSSTAPSSNRFVVVDCTRPHSSVGFAALARACMMHYYPALLPGTTTTTQVASQNQMQDLSARQLYAGRVSASPSPIPAPVNIGVKTAETSATRQGQLENRKTVSRHAEFQISGRFGSNPAVFDPAA